VRANLALLLVSTLLVLLGTELAIRSDLVPEPRYFESTGWWREHWLRGRPGPIPKKFVALDRELGWIPAPNLRDVKLSGARINTNSASMRGAREFAREPGAAPRVVAVGDSYTFGQCVDDAQTFPAQLERLMPGSEVLNLGVMGYGHDQALLRLRRDGLPYRPDVVVLGFHRMDMARNRLGFRDFAKPRFVLRDGRLDLRGVPVPEPQQIIDSLQPRLWNYARVALDRAFKDRFNREEIALTQAIVRQMRDESAAAGARFVLLYLPDADDLESPEPWVVHWLTDTCREDELHCVSPVRRVRRALERQDFEEHFDCHYSPRVYELVAKELVSALERRDWLPVAAP
jgi:hypothetical protein